MQQIEQWDLQIEQRVRKQHAEQVYVAIAVVLHDGSSHEGTVTSMEPNDDTFLLYSEIEKKGKTKSVHMVDVLGHSRLKEKLDEFLPQVAELIFVVDSLDFLPNCRVVDVTNDYTLGVPGEPFSFSHCENKVMLAESSALTGEVSQVEQFIREHVKP